MQPLHKVQKYKRCRKNFGTVKQETFKTQKNNAKEKSINTHRRLKIENTYGSELKMRDSFSLSLFSLFFRFLSPFFPVSVSEPRVEGKHGQEKLSLSLNKTWSKDVVILENFARKV